MNYNVKSRKFYELQCKVKKDLQCIFPNFILQKGEKMNCITEDQVYKALSNVLDPDLNQDIVSLGFIKNLHIQGNDVSFAIELTTPACPFKQKIRDAAETYVRQIPSIGNVDITLTSQVLENKFSKKSSLKGVKHIIAIASGKGGVGKSTVSANIALALAKTGAKIGLLDADIYGPSIPLLLNTQGSELNGTEQEIIPVQRYGISMISMGYLLPKEEAVIWRGPMLSKIVSQFLLDVQWGELDYLIVDLPPGTGDVQLGLCQQVEVSGVVIVSTPQEAAWSIAQKAISMFQQLEVPILGLVENMSYYICPHCNEKEYIFGEGGAKKLAQKLHLPFLGEIPLATSVRTNSDKGTPIVISDENSPIAQAFHKIACEMAAQISKCVLLEI